MTVLNSKTVKDRTEIANRILQAERTRVCIEPLTRTDPGLTAADAYDIQLQIVRCKLAEGKKISGKKIGLTSAAMQQMLGVFEPDYGHLFDTMAVRSGAAVQISSLIQPKIEGEIAFVLKTDLAGPEVTVEDVLNATDCVVPALEIIDSRIRYWEIKLQDTVADNGSSALYVVGAKQTRAESVALPSVPMQLKKNGEITVTGSGDAVMGNPAAAVAWLANKLTEFGVELSAGEVVLSGSFGKAIDVRVGDFIEADFGPLGVVSVRFV